MAKISNTKDGWSGKKAVSSKTLSIAKDDEIVQLRQVALSKQVAENDVILVPDDKLINDLPADKIVSEQGQVTEASGSISVGEQAGINGLVLAAVNAEAGAGVEAAAGTEAAAGAASAAAATGGIGAGGGIALAGAALLAGGVAVAAGSSSSSTPAPAGTTAIHNDATVADAQAGNWAAGTYNLKDTGAHLMAAPAAVVNGAINITVSDAVSVANADIIAAFTNSGVTIFSGLTDTVAHLVPGGVAYSHIGSNTTVTITDASVAATDLTTIDNATTVAVDATAVTTITGTAAAIDAVATEIGAGTISAANFAAAPTTAASVAQANNIDAHNGTGTITATITDHDAATLATLTGTHAYTIAVTDASVAATDLTAIDNATSVAVDATAVTTITGTAAAIDAVATEIGAGTITAGNFAAAPTTAASVVQVNNIDAHDGTGTITATITDHDAATLATLTGTHAYTIAVTDASVAATDLTAIDNATSVAVDATAVTTITGTAAAIDAVATEIGAGTITAGNFAAAPTTAASVAQVNNIDAHDGTGTITATITDHDAATLATLTGTHAYTITITDTTVAATDLTAIDNATSIPVDATAMTMITGTVAAIDAVEDEVEAGTIIITGDIDDAASPIIVDLNGDGVHTLALSSGVMFDINATGNKIHTGWVSPQDGLLVMDRNHDEVINDGTELFGTATILSSGRPAADGYEALKAMDTNGDHVLGSADQGFADLRVWVDANSDGVSQPGELHTLASLGITEFNLNADPSSLVDQGNLVGLTSTYETVDGATHAMADVWFSTQGGGTLTHNISDTSDHLAQAFTSSDPGLTAAQNAAVVDVAGGPGTLVLDADQFSNLLAGSSLLAADDTIQVGGHTANLGTLHNFGGNGTLILGDNAENGAFSVDLGATNITAIHLEGTGDHQVTLQAGHAGVETITIGTNQDSGSSIANLHVNDVINVEGATLTTLVANADAVQASGQYYFDNGSDKMTYYNDSQHTTDTLILAGVATVHTDENHHITVAAIG